MATVNYIIKKPRKPRLNKIKKKDLSGSPQKKGYCSKVYYTNPKKPNSAKRKVAKIILYKTKKKIIAHIPGEDHNLKEHSQVLIHGANVRDLPGVKYRVIRGVYDANGVKTRVKKRSKYGTKKNK